MRSAGGACECGTPAQTIIDPEIGSHHHPRFVPIAILLHSFIHKAADASHNGFRFIRPPPNATKNKPCPSGCYHVMRPHKGRVSELWIQRWRSLRALDAVRGIREGSRNLDICYLIRRTCLNILRQVTFDFRIVVLMRHHRFHGRAIRGFLTGR
jgi:hypothetical protein